MAEYKSAYTGPQIDAAIGAVAGKQDTLVSGTNIKTINNESLLGSGNINIQGGGGSSDFNVRVIDATNPDDWDSEEQSPSQAVLEDIATNLYQAVRMANVQVDEDTSYEIDMFLTDSISLTGDSSYYVRQYQKFDSGNEDEEGAAFVQVFTFTKEDDNDAEMDVAAYSLGGDNEPQIYVEYAPIIGLDDNEFNVNLPDLSRAIEDGKEVVIKVGNTANLGNRYFRVSQLPQSMTYFGDPVFNSYWVPEFKCVASDGEYYAEFEKVEDGSFYYKIYEGNKRFTPSSLDMDHLTIAFSSDDKTEIFNKKPLNIAINLDDESGEFWVQFKKVLEDNTQGSESYTYTSDIIALPGLGFIVYTFTILNNSDTIETTIAADILSTTVPV